MADEVAAIDKHQDQSKGQKEAQVGRWSGCRRRYCSRLISCGGMAFGIISASSMYLTSNLMNTGSIKLFRILSSY